MTFSDKIKTTDAKTKQGSIKFRQPAQISASSSKNVVKYEFLKDRNILPKKTFRKRC